MPYVIGYDTVGSQTDYNIGGGSYYCDLNHADADQGGGAGPRGVVVSAGDTLTEAGIYLDHTGGATTDTTVPVGIYDLDDIDTTGAALLETINIPWTNAQKTGAAGWVVATGLTIDLTAYAGLRVGIGRADPADDSAAILYYDNVGSGRNLFADLGSGGLPSPFPATNDYYNQQVSLYARVTEGGTPEEVDFTAAASAAAAFSIVVSTPAALTAAATATAAQVNSANVLGAFTAAGSAGATLSNVVAVAVGFTAAAAATAAQSGPANVLGSLSAAGSAGAVLSTVQNAIAALAAGASAGESWVNSANALVSLLAAGSAGATLNNAATETVNAALSEATTASATFVNSLNVLAVFTAAGNAAAAMVGLGTAILLLSASGDAQAAFVSAVGLRQVALNELASGAASFTTLAEVSEIFSTAAAGSAQFGPLVSVAASLAAAVTASAAFNQGIIDERSATFEAALTAAEVVNAVCSVVAVLSASVNGESVLTVVTAVNSAFVGSASAAAFFHAFTGDKGLILIKAITLKAAISAIVNSLEPAMSVTVDTIH